MHRQEPIMLLAAFALVLAAQPAASDEIGGSGFAVPQRQQENWLWGVEGLARTPIDFSANVGLAFIDYEMKNVVQHIDNPAFDLNGNLDIGNSTGVVENDGDLGFKPEAFQGGFRFSGGIGYWNCCVLIEPALAFWGHHPFGSGNDRFSGGRQIADPTDDDEIALSRVQIKEGWDLVFGPQMTWLIREDIPFVGQFLGGMPLVFFPFVGIAHQEWETTLTKLDGPIGGGADPVSRERNFQEDMFVVGFDLDVPLPGAIGPFTHAITFGYKWTDGNDKHDMFEFADISEPRKFVYKSTEGSRYELRYTVFWHDMEGFFKRFIFGPAS